MRGLRAALVFAILIALGASGPRALVAGETPETSELGQRLRETMVTLSIEHQELGQVLAMLQLQTGFNLVIDPRIEADVRQSIVTGLFVENLALPTVLDMLAAAAGEEAVWIPQGNVMILTSRELVRDATTVRIYPVAAFTTRRTAFVPPRSGLLGTEDEEDAQDDRRASRADLPFGSADELIELLKAAVSPAYWEETEGVDIRTDGEHRLVVRAAPKIHAAIDRHLADLVDMIPDAVQVDIWAIAPAATESEEAPTDAAISDEEAAALLAGPRAGPALSLAVRPGLSSTTFAGTRRAHLAGYEARFGKVETSLDPHVASFETGMAAWVRALPGPAGRAVLLKLDVAIAKPRDERKHATLATGEVPLVARELVRRRSTLLVTPGRWHWMEGRTGGEDAGRWGFLVRATPMRGDPRPAPGRAAYEMPTPVSPGYAPAFANRRIKHIHWDEVNLDQALAYLRTITQLNYYITPRLRDEMFEDTVISFDVKDVSLAFILDLITEPWELTWRAKDGLVTLDVRDHAREAMALRYFDVRDLAEHLRPAPIEASPDAEPEGETLESRPVFEGDSLVELIRESIGREEAWEDSATIEARNGILIARNTPPILDAVGRLLDGLRASRQLVVTTIEQLEMDDTTARALLGVAGGGRSSPLLSAEDASALDAAVASGRVLRLSRERVVSLDGSGEPRDTGTAIPYVADYEIEDSSSSDTSAPVRRIETIHSGTQIQLRGTPVHPVDLIYLELVMKRAVLAFMGSAETLHGPVDLPVVKAWEVSTGLRIPDGRTAIVSAGRIPDRWRVLLVSPRRVSLDD